MIQTKIIWDRDEEKVELKLNKWLEEQQEDPTFHLNDIKYQRYSVLVIYNKESEKEKERRYEVGMQMLEIMKGETND